MTDENDIFRPPEIPEGHIPLHAVIVVSYLDPEGDKSYSTYILGSSTVGDLIALLELGKDDVLAERRKKLND